MEQELRSVLASVYGDYAEGMIKELDRALAEHIKAKRSIPHSTIYWYKFIELYCVYPDGVMYDPELLPLQNLKKHLAQIKALGCSAVHILPFLASPMVDNGFDISDFYAIRPELGTFEHLSAIIEEAKRLDLQLFMDVVFNHVSDQHPWFQKAQAGDPRYQEYFIRTEQEPKFIRKFYRNSAIWAEYQVDGASILINIAFPEHAGPIPHWRRGNDGYWYYHTYYPEQLDLNWLNPNVFVELAQVLIYWAALGFNFRLDAIPFIGKSAYKATDSSNETTNAIIAALKLVVKSVNPECAFLIESYELIDTVIGYFGHQNQLQANLSYNFHLCTSLWVCLINQDVAHLWATLEAVSKIPPHAEWLNFLRNHDELSLAYLPDDLLRRIRTKLDPYGADFREGCGIAGRTLSFLQENPERFLMAYFLLASLPGGIVIPYGDEIGVTNIPAAELPQEKQKDTRNINRGLITGQQYIYQEQRDLFKQFALIIGHRKMLRDYLNNWPKKLDAAAREIFAASYSNAHGQLSIYINLSAETKTLSIEPGWQQIAAINQSSKTDTELSLGAYAGVWLIT